MNKIVILILITYVISVATSTCTVSDSEKVDCGYVGINQSQCETKGCCWVPSQRPGLPWCFNKGGDNPNPPNPDQKCSVAESDKIDCGISGINQSGCEAKGCCWVPSSISGQPWCFNQEGDNPCAEINFTSKTPGFTQANYDTMYALFVKNINIGGQGGVVAALDYDTPAGSYYYHWSRDGALTMRAFQELNNFDLNKIETNMNAYVSWVNTVHSLSDPNGIDIRIEVKYELPSPKVYTGGWCRPQNDGPPLQAITLIKYAQVLIKAGKTDYVKKYLWTGSNAYNGGAIKYDLDYIPQGHTSFTCDLWEDTTSTDLFWNKFTSRYAMILGAEFATQMGDIASATIYSQTAKNIESTLISSHYKNNFITEDSIRQKDAAVIVGLNDGYAGDSLLPPYDVMVANTIKVYNTQACVQYPINQKDTAANIPGILYGRYTGDVYAGGNPWVLTSAALAQLNAQHFKAGNTLTSSQLTAWKTVITTLSDNPTSAELYSAFLSAGDAVLQRVYYHVKSYDFHLAEQIDKNTGAQTSAKDLTWSYAEVLKALQVRRDIAGSLGEVEQEIYL